jgi:methionyl aminopeptidase
MVMLGDVHPDVQALSKATREAMFKAIEICKPGQKYS